MTLKSIGYRIGPRCADVDEHELFGSPAEESEGANEWEPEVQVHGAAVEYSDDYLQRKRFKERFGCSPTPSQAELDEGDWDDLEEELGGGGGGTGGVIEMGGPGGIRMWSPR